MLRRTVSPVCDVDVLWPNGWTDQDETSHVGRPRPQPHHVRWRPAPPKRGTAPHFSAHVHYGQTAVWIKMALAIGQIPLRYPGRRLGLRPGRRPVASWNLAYHALSSSLAGS